MALIIQSFRRAISGKNFNLNPELIKKRSLLDKSQRDQIAESGEVESWLDLDESKQKSEG